MERKVIVDGQTYTESIVRLMSEEEICALKKRILDASGDVAIKKQQYRNNNSEGENSKEYWKKMASYKTVSIKLAQANSWVSEILKEKRKESHADREHWLFTFYYEAKRTLPKFLVNKIVSATKQRCGYDIEINIKED